MTFKDGLAQSEKAYQQFTDVNSLFAKAVKEDFLYTWQWWFGLALFIAPWVVWFIFRDKERTGRLLLAGLLTIVLSLTIDMAALAHGLWSYPMMFIPAAPFLFLPYHYSLAPVGIMFAQQLFPNMNTFLKGVLFSLLSAFGAMKFFAALDFYDPKHWSSFYDFIIFLALYYLAYWISKVKGFEPVGKRSS